MTPEVIESLETWEELADAARMVAEDMDTHGEKEYNTCIRNAPAQLRTAGSVSQMRRHHD